MSLVDDLFGYAEKIGGYAGEAVDAYSQITIAEAEKLQAKNGGSSQAPRDFPEVAQEPNSDVVAGPVSMLTTNNMLLGGGALIFILLIIFLLVKK